MVKRHYLFRSKHYPRGKYNEIHPCRIVRQRWVEQGWYINSYYRVSRFRGIKLPLISFGLISGYRKHRVPYIIFHWGNTFYVPTFFLGNGLLLIKCEYANNDWKSQTRLLLARMKREKQKFTRN
jgi:hypothetical protein